MTDKLVERVARAICLSQGQDPDEDAPTHLVCGPNNEVEPMWCFYEEQAQAAIESLTLPQTDLEPVPEQDSWQGIETAPKDGLIDIWFVRSDGSGERRVDCYYDNICGEWRTSRPGGLLVCIKERHVTHWRYQPNDPGAASLAPQNKGASQEDGRP